MTVFRGFFFIPNYFKALRAKNQLQEDEEDEEEEEFRRHLDGDVTDVLFQHQQQQQQQQQAGLEKTRLKKKNSAQWVFWVFLFFFWIFLYICPEERFLGFF
jgi:hypothetical protein